ncbi:dTDP-4-dehydrorhamnose 3,5-epimerase [Paracoccus sp. M683]|uniref:dTDP-4-dehydrorhamnose 3,5-epimerase family protein n=1 Tax=Paracoccus sp. M683 TaxID=2594268 RepID=UPI00117C6261|nr:dTDP-4-dehydrorhamnose 3,5-epimerase family protein [Paracoccus sp. M683]TRW97627.1 dTDP-4-dehydrorhamnose 3,5-epimerase [Paracoccus sp. M683]
MVIRYQGKEIPPDHVLCETLGAAQADQQTTTDDGSATLTPRIEGATRRASPTHVDERGRLFEVYSRDWFPDDEPVEHVYVTTLRPGIVKGWGLHERHVDRYFLISGEMQVVLYDVRPDSPSCGKLSVITLGPENRQLLRIPAYVWHADVNIGETEAVLLNMPTMIYDYRNPDKHRLPPDTPLIPYDFGGRPGW